MLYVHLKIVEPVTFTFAAPLRLNPVVPQPYIYVLSLCMPVVPSK